LFVNAYLFSALLSKTFLYLFVFPSFSFLIEIKENGISLLFLFEHDDPERLSIFFQEFLFGKRKTPAEMLKQHQRALAKAQRELDREREKLERQEKKLIADIKKSAKENQMGACKVMAKDLVRTRRNVQKFYQMKTQLQAVGLRIQV
jgi:septal ring factor EnvC (AmiA/AmiB activator)